MATKPAKRIRPGDQVQTPRMVVRTSFEVDGQVTLGYEDGGSGVFGPDDAMEVIDGGTAP